MSALPETRRVLEKQGLRLRLTVANGKVIAARARDVDKGKVRRWFAGEPGHD